MDIVSVLSEFYAEAPQATVSEGLAQGPYMVARVEFKPATLQTKGVESTNEPPRPQLYITKKIGSGPYASLKAAICMTCC